MLLYLIVCGEKNQTNKRNKIKNNHTIFLRLCLIHIQ